jgi:hypothetical protein
MRLWKELTMVRQVERWAPLGGIIFVVLMVVGTMFVADVPDADASRQEIAQYLGDGDDHTRNIVGAYMWVLGGLAFLWFLTRLRSDLRQAEGGTGALSNLAFGAGVVFTAVWMVSASAFAAVAYAAKFGDAPVSNADLVRVLPQMAWLILLLGGGFVTLFLALLVSVLILQTGVFPRWLAWLGIVVAIVQLFDVVYESIFPFLAWALVASIVMLLRRQKAPVTATAGV